MAADAPPTEPVPDTETELDEANITSSLARLQDMHAAVRFYGDLQGYKPRLTWMFH